MMNSFADSKRQSKLKVARAFVSINQQSVSKFENRIPEMQALLDMVDKKLKPRGFRGGSRVNKKVKRGGYSLQILAGKYYERRVPSEKETLGSNLAVVIPLKEVRIPDQTSFTLKLIQTVSTVPLSLSALITLSWLSPPPSSYVFNCSDLGFLGLTLVLVIQS